MPRTGALVVQDTANQKKKKGSGIVAGNAESERRMIKNDTQDFGCDRPSKKPSDYSGK
jgi:hypothetical protein